MSRPKRRTAAELSFFSHRAMPDPNVEICTADQMPVPARISEDKTKLELWQFIVTDMEHRKCLSPTYTLLISEMVETATLLHKCRTNLDKNGLTYDKYDDEGSFLGSFVNPNAVIADRAQGKLLKLIEKLGMSPRDIVYLVNPEASAAEVIEVRNSELKGITYFR